MFLFVASFMQTKQLDCSKSTKLDTKDRVNRTIVSSQYSERKINLRKIKSLIKPLYITTMEVERNMANYCVQKRASVNNYSAVLHLHTNEKTRRIV